MTQKINSNIGTFLGHPVITHTPGNIPVAGSLYFDQVDTTFKIYTGVKWVNVDSVNQDFFIPQEKVEEKRLLETNLGLAQLKREAEEAEEKYQAYLALCKE